MSLHLHNGLRIMSLPPELIGLADVVIMFKCRDCTFATNHSQVLLAHLQNSHQWAAYQRTSAEAHYSNFSASAQNSGAVDPLPPRCEINQQVARPLDSNSVVQGTDVASSEATPQLFTTNIFQHSEGHITASLGANTELHVDIHANDTMRDSDSSSKGDHIEQQLTSGSTTKETTYQCGACLASFTSAVLVEKHMLQEHASDLPEERAENLANARMKEPQVAQSKALKSGRKTSDYDYEWPFACKEKGCYAKYKKQFELDYHKRCHFKDPNTSDKFVCPECGFRTKYCKFLKAHLWVKHKIGHGMHRCPICGTATYSKYKLQNHITVHSQEKPCVCTECGKCFKTNRALTEHSFCMHRPEEKQKRNVPQVCDVCGKTLANLKSFQKHKREMHVPKRFFHCRYCDYKAVRSHYITLHERSAHTKEKPFACSYCDFRTSDKSTLRRHEHRHTGEKPYLCIYCGYSCIQSSTFKQHIRSKHPGCKLDHSCPYCSFCSVNSESLKHHLSTHKEEREKLSENDSAIAEWTTMTVAEFVNQVEQSPKTQNSANDSNLTQLQNCTVDVAQGLMQPLKQKFCIQFSETNELREQLILIQEVKEASEELS